MSNLVLVALFGAIGSVSRFALIQATPKITYINFPVGTILVNLIGSFFIGVVASMFDKHLLSSEVRTFIVFGFLGGFTTFSAFTYEVFNLVKSGNYLNLFVYLFVSIVVSLFLFYFGYKLVKIFI
ncbi:MAG: fluoride efflux transporter CrcB [Pelagibacteraceae bacterium]